MASAHHAGTKPHLFCLNNRHDESCSNDSDASAFTAKLQCDSSVTGK